ncbi:hypothetical protein [Sphingomonas quercus]|uniref:Uncharacterized protein n=1 Tax=Sphingomonas quercus TaxID=2842451 RepID=A0ABS6BKU1_9SPHN|nr:hypothetical protein [Sphingomonas quercus]MBU3077874.1 hypothetical protein [Sphingomonas quercus]
MTFSDTVILLPTKATDLVVMLKAELLDCWWRTGRERTIDEVIVNNMELICDMAADQLEFGLDWDGTVILGDELA